MRATVASRLLDHYRMTARDLPWRTPPGGPRADPYLVWLSEVMLQQTGVAAVIPRFARFVARWPSIDALAGASDADILGEWAGLGYYARARNLVACARAIVARGGFPQDEAGWRALPGIGAYTAAAIAAIALGQRAVVVDTNVERVVARLHALADAKAVRAAADALTPRTGDAGDYAQAMMDLGATICRPRAPACPVCPLRTDCTAFADGNPEAYPVRKAKATRPLRYGVADWHRRGDSILLVRRPPKGMLGGMAALPGGEWGPGRRAGDSLAVIRHDFTHFSLDLAVVAGDGAAAAGGWWQPLRSIDRAGLPTLYRKAVEKVLANGG